MTDPILYNADFFTTYQGIKSETVDLILTDPPYSIFKNEHSLSIAKNDPAINLTKLEKAFDYLLKPNGSLLIFCNDNLLDRIKDNFITFEIWHKYFLIKSVAMPKGKTNPINNVEYLISMKRKPVKPTEIYFNPYNGDIKKPYSKKNYKPDIPIRKMKKRSIDENKTGQRYLKTAINIQSKCNLPEKERSGHPFQKPEKVLRKMIKAYSRPGELIIDPFAGSASTLISAFKEKRNSIGYEIDSVFYEEASQRINDNIKQLQLF